MDFIEIAKKRYSVRSYRDRKVEEEKLEKILEAAHAAPTAANLQPVRLIVVRSREGLGKIGKAADLYGAPLAIIVCADHEKAWVRPYDKKKTTDINASILTDHMMLQAAEEGLVYCIIDTQPNLPAQASIGLRCLHSTMPPHRLVQAPCR